MTTLTETLHAGAFIISEEENYHCRDSVQFALSQTIVTGQVLGKTAVIASVTSSVAADAGNTGNGVFTIDGTAPVGAGAINGNYRVVCVTAAANSGIFLVEDPRGREIGRVAVGATFNNQIKFAIADGATDFIVGDAFTVTVGIEDGDFDYKALDTTATTGEQRAAAIAFDAITTDGSTKKKQTAMVRGPAQVRGTDLTWPGGISAANKAQAITELAALGIIVR